MEKWTFSSYLVLMCIGCQIKLFIISLEYSDQGIKSLRVVLLDIKFNARSIKSKDIGEGGINSLTDWLSETWK